MIKINTECKKYFKHYCFTPEIIMISLYMKGRYSLSYREIEEISRMRGLDIDHATLQRWVVKFMPILIRWKNYYGRFYLSALQPIWYNFNEYLIRWVQRKFKRFSRHKMRAIDYINRIARSCPYLFIHWKQGVFPGGKVVGAV